MVPWYHWCFNALYCRSRLGLLPNITITDSAVANSKHLWSSHAKQEVFNGPFSARVAVYQCHLFPEVK